MLRSDDDYAAVAEIHRNTAALEFLSAVLDCPPEELPAIPLDGVGHICRLVCADLQRALVKLQG